MAQSERREEEEEEKRRGERKVCAHFMCDKGDTKKRGKIEK